MDKKKIGIFTFQNNLFSLFQKHIFLQNLIFSKIFCSNIKVFSYFFKSVAVTLKLYLIKAISSLISFIIRILFRVKGVFWNPTPSVALLNILTVADSCTHHLHQALSCSVDGGAPIHFCCSSFFIKLIHELFHDPTCLLNILLTKQQP